MKILVIQFSYCQCSTLKWTACTELEIRWFYRNVYVPDSNWWKQISHRKPLLKFKLLRSTLKGRLELPTVMCSTVTCVFVRGRGKMVLQWKLLFRFISLTTKAYYLHCQQPDTQTGHIWLYIIVIMNFFISTTIDNIMTIISSPVFFGRSYTVRAHTILLLCTVYHPSFRCQHAKYLTMSSVSVRSSWLGFD